MPAPFSTQELHQGLGSDLGIGPAPVEPHLGRHVRPIDHKRVPGQPSLPIGVAQEATTAMGTSIRSSDAHGRSRRASTRHFTLINWPS